MIVISNILHHMPFGAKRREMILMYLRGDPSAYITVNRKWCVQLHQDPDLTRLLKQGKLKRDRWGTRSCRHTHLVLNQ